MQINSPYVLITSAYNEEKFIERCIRSVLKQTITPKEWIIIDNGSTDTTPEIIKNFSKENKWITYLFKSKENYNIHGYHAVINFYFGFNNLNETGFEFVGNLDADIEIERRDYYEFLINELRKNSKIGIATGITYYINDKGEKKLVWHESYHTTGGLKFYRKECLSSIERLIPDFGWDGIDEMKAMARGWQTLTFFELEVNHWGKLRDLDRQFTAAYHFNRGNSLYKRGYPFWFIIMKSLQAIKDHSISCSYHFLKGYIKGIIKRQELVMTIDEIIFTKKFLKQRMKGKIFG